MSAKQGNRTDVDPRGDWPRQVRPEGAKTGTCSAPLLRIAAWQPAEQRGLSAET